MTIADAVTAGFRGYFDFAGRAGRSEFWYFVLFYTVVCLVLTLIDIALLGEDGILFSGIFALVMLIPSISVTVRRLHDIDRSGWWTLLWIVPVIGWGVMIYWHCQPSEPAHAGIGAAKAA